VLGWTGWQALFTGTFTAFALAAVYCGFCWPGTGQLAAVGFVPIQ
jgi:hypothetical protein